jgi:hypothetical protein
MIWDGRCARDARRVLEPRLVLAPGARAAPNSVVYHAATRPLASLPSLTRPHWTGDNQWGAPRGPSAEQTRNMVRRAKTQGQLPKRPNGTDCKSVGLRLRRFESSTAHHPASAGSLRRGWPGPSSSVVERNLGKVEVTGSIPVSGSHGPPQVHLAGCVAGLGSARWDVCCVQGYIPRRSAGKREALVRSGAVPDVRAKES